MHTPDQQTQDGPEGEPTPTGPVLQMIHNNPTTSLQTRATAENRSLPGCSAAERARSIMALIGRIYQDAVRRCDA